MRSIYMLIMFRVLCQKLNLMFISNLYKHKSSVYNDVFRAMQILYHLNVRYVLNFLRGNLGLSQLMYTLPWLKMDAMRPCRRTHFTHIPQTTYNSLLLLAIVKSPYHINLQCIYGPSSCSLNQNCLTMVSQQQTIICQ